MPFEVSEEGRVLVVSVSGQMRRADYDAFWKRGAEAIRQHGAIRVLLMGQEFQGWERGGEWADFDVVAERDRHIEKIAIVADEKWKDEILMFMGSPFREVAIEFFSRDRLADARKWVQD